MSDFLHGARRLHVELDAQAPFFRHIEHVGDALGQMQRLIGCSHRREHAVFRLVNKVEVAHEVAFHVTLNHGQNADFRRQRDERALQRRQTTHKHHEALGHDHIRMVEDAHDVVEQLRHVHRMRVFGAIAIDQCAEILQKGAVIEALARHVLHAPPLNEQIREPVAILRDHGLHHFKEQPALVRREFAHHAAIDPHDLAWILLARSALFIGKRRSHNEIRRMRIGMIEAVFDHLPHE